MKRILIYPVKSLPPLELDACEVSPQGQLQGDRCWKLVDEQDRTLNAKGSSRFHRIRGHWKATGDNRHRFEFKADTLPNLSGTLPEDQDRLAQWCGSVLGTVCRLVHCGSSLAFTDDLLSTGPTLIGSSSLESLSDLYPHIDALEWSQRLRPNLEIEGTAPFAEDEWLPDFGTAAVVDYPRIRVGQVEWFVTQPCQRCVVPSREPGTGVREPDFAARVATFRLDRRPSGVDPKWFPHGYKLGLNTAPASIPQKAIVRLGDPVEWLE